MDGILAFIGLLIFWELSWWFVRRERRARGFLAAKQLASSLNIDLIVVGNPDSGMTSGYGWGDLTIDIKPSRETQNHRHLLADITQPLPLLSSSAVVFVSCVFEYVSDYHAAYSELFRVSGGRLIIVTVEPWTLTAFLYPGARRILLRSRQQQKPRPIEFNPIRPKA